MAHLRAARRPGHQFHPSVVGFAAHHLIITTLVEAAIDDLQELQCRAARDRVIRDLMRWDEMWAEVGAEWRRSFGARVCASKLGSGVEREREREREGWERFGGNGRN